MSSNKKSEYVQTFGKKKNATNAKARRLLGWTPRSNEDAIVATAESMVRLGLLKGGARGLSRREP